MNSTNTTGDLQAWIGRSESRKDLIAATPLRALFATLDCDSSAASVGEEVPPLAHWLYFTPTAPQREIGADGHPQRGAFLPPVELPRRMWAGGTLEFLHSLKVGDEVARQSRIVDLTTKDGRSGSLAFVTIRHDITSGRGLAISESQEIVFRSAPLPGAAPVTAKDAPTDESFRREISPDPVLLFRYSALTFNAHRIHYDRPYATEVEGYPGLVVHGPLVATLLMNLLQRHMPTARVRRFSFKATSPLFDVHRFSLCGRADGPREFSLWARSHDGKLAMHANAEIA